MYRSIQYAVVSTLLAGFALTGGSVVRANPLPQAVSSSGAVIEIQGPLWETVSPAVEGESDVAELAGEPESAEDVWDLWGLEAIESPFGVESIIGADQRVKIGNTKVKPYRYSALVTFDGGRCTGWLYGADVVATSGHCVHLMSTGTWAKNVKVFLGRNGNKKPYGSCKAYNLWTWNKWIATRNPLYDVGVIKLKCEKSRKFGWFGYFTAKGTNAHKGKKANIQGFPGDKPLTMWESKGKIKKSKAKKVGYKLDTLGGMSGSAVWRKKSGCGRCAYGVHGYGVGGMFGSLNGAVRITKEQFNFLQFVKRCPHNAPCR